MTLDEKQHQPSFKNWILATRPKTLFASFIPVLLASSLAYHHQSFSWLVFGLCTVCAILMQIEANFFNELYDFKRGADTSARLGPERAVSLGYVSGKQMLRASVLVALVAFALGLWLVALSNWYILIIGVCSLVASWAYTGGRRPLAYLGLGEVFAFIFFGIVAVCGTYFAHSGTLANSAAVLSLVPAFFASNILLVNNIRDIKTDLLANKRTIVVRFGESFGRMLFRNQLLAAQLGLLGFCVMENLSLFLLLPHFVGSLYLVRKVDTSEGRELNSVLAGTALLLLVDGLVVGVALVFFP